MRPTVGRWRDAFELLSPKERAEVWLRAYEAVARFCDRSVVSEPTPNSLTITSDPAATMFKDYEVYVRKARRYQMRQTAVQEWRTEKDLARTLAWKAVNEVRDHLRKMRTELSHKTANISVLFFRSDQVQKFFIEAVLDYFEHRQSKVAADAVVLIEYLWGSGSALTRTPKRGVSFKTKSIANALTEQQSELWTEDRVQRTRRFIIEEISQFRGDTIAEVVRVLRKATK